MRQTQARRIPLPEDGHAWAVVTEAGDYCGPVPVEWPDGVRQVVYFLLPIARDDGVPRGARSVHSISQPPHTIRECPDGSLEIRASIGAGRGDGPNGGYYWHGYLNEGNVWQEI